MAARPRASPARRPSRAGVSVESRQVADGTERFYARYTDPRGRRHVVKPPDGDSTWPDWGEAFTAACTAQNEALRLTYRSRDGDRLLFRDLVRDHYLPSLRDASPNTRKNTASHLGDGSGVPTRSGLYGERAARSQLLFAFGHLPIGGIGPSEVQQWISQMAADGYDLSTIRAKRSLLRSILRVAVDQGWLVQNVVDATRLPRAVEQPDEDRVVTPEEWAQVRLQLSGEGTLLLCDLALDCGLRYEEVIALRPMDVIEGDKRNASHVWIRQAITWPGRAYSGGTVPWLVGPTKGKRFRKVAVSARLFDRFRLYVDAHGRQPRSLVFDYPLLRAEHAQAREGCQRQPASPPADTSVPAMAAPGSTARPTPTPWAAAAPTAATPTPKRGSGPAAPRARNRPRHGWTPATLPTAATRSIR